VTDTAKGRELLAAATLGPWPADEWFGANGDEWTAIGPVHKVAQDEDSDPDSPAAKRARADALAIAWLRNNAESMMDAVEQNERLKENYTVLHAEANAVVERAATLEGALRGAGDTGEALAALVAAKQDKASDALGLPGIRLCSSDECDCDGSIARRALAALAAARAALGVVP
jgi:hypothetical protein